MNFKLKIEQKKKLWERFVQSSNLAENQQPKALLHNLQVYKFYPLELALQHDEHAKCT
jgi:hypothetical protein